MVLQVDKNAGMASLTAKLHADFARTRECSSGRLFVDLEVAFGTIVREIALLHCNASTASIDDLIKSHKFPNELGVVLKNFITSGSGGVLMQAGVDPALHKMLSDLTRRAGSRYHGVTRSLMILRSELGNGAQLVPCCSILSTNTCWTKFVAE